MALRGLKRGEKRGLEELHRAATTKEEINNSGNGGESGGVADSLSAVEALPKDEEDLRAQSSFKFVEPQLVPIHLQQPSVGQLPGNQPSTLVDLGPELFEFTSTCTNIPAAQASTSTGPVVDVKPGDSALPVVKVDLGYNLSTGDHHRPSPPKKKKRTPRSWSEEELNPNDLKEKWWRMVLKDPSLQQGKEGKNMQHVKPGAVKRKQIGSSAVSGSKKRKCERKPKEFSGSTEEHKNSVTV